MKPRPCGASGNAPERDRRKREPWDRRRRGVRCGVGTVAIVVDDDESVGEIGRAVARVKD